MTSTLKRTSQAVAEWSKVFPCQGTETYTSSVTFIKQLTLIAVSTITYLKNAFPEDNYTIYQFGGLKIRVLKNKCDDELAQFLITALTQAFEAFEKKYLHQIALCFYEERCCPENLLEYHLFEYGYGAGAGQGASLRVRSAARGGGETNVTFGAVRNRTMQLLRACMVMSSNTQLPEKYDVSLRLYYNDDAPENYQAPGFSAAPEADADEVVRTGRIKLGSVHTPFHCVQLRTYHHDMCDNTSEASQSTTVLSQQPDELASSGCEAATGEEGASPPPAPRGVRCACARDDTTQHMLLCGWCGCMQHAVCYGVRPTTPPLPPAAHCCLSCAERGAGICADAGLLRVSNRTCYAIFRRALWWVSESAAGGLVRVSTGALCGVLSLNVASARKLMRVLRKHGVIATDPPSDTETEVDVVPSQLEVALARHFRALPSPCRRSRVEEPSSQEQFASQEAVSAALSPLERGHDGATLAEYRAALAPLTTAPSPLPAPRKRKQPSRAPGVKTKRMKKADQAVFPDFFHLSP